MANDPHLRRDIGRGIIILTVLGGLHGSSPIARSAHQCHRVKAN